MRQYFAIKAKHPGAVLLFRVGDFYETFGEDAILVSKVLGIVLTRRSNGAAAEVELAGFPHHALDTYLPKLVKAGFRVAVCDQLEDPKQAKGIVKRGVTELVTPGVTFNDKVLDVNEANYLAAVHFAGKDQVGVAFVEASTGEFFCFSGGMRSVEKILHTLSPAEVLVAKREIRHFKEHFGEGFYLSRLDEWVFQESYALEKLLGHFKTNSLKGFGVDQDGCGAVAAGAVLHYLEETQQQRLEHIAKISRFDDSDYVWLDQFTVRNLELVRPLHPEGKSLVDMLDETTTPMGARLLRKTLLLPLKARSRIQQRLDTVETFLRHHEAFRQLQEILGQIGDLERLSAKIATRRLSPKEAALLRRSLELLTPLRETLRRFGEGVLQGWLHNMENEGPALEVLNTYLREEPSAQLSDGQVIREGISPELDELRNIKQNSRELLLAMQQREVAQTGITSLKIGFNKVFGYYLEVTHAHKDKVPDAWIRKQTLTNAERYITEELKAYEEKILSAEERILALELDLYQEFLLKMQGFLFAFQSHAQVLAEIDLLSCFAKVAQHRHYVKPEVNESESIRIQEGRHPVIEVQLPVEAPYIPNDIHLDKDGQQIVIVTGPNMAGKSALLRQTALIVLLAQVGAFVPARSASIGIVDKIFTRVGASDNISSGESTFMVEMNETAQIANNATNRSLVLLDEIGRGTSTYDGVSIAWALVEYLHETPGCQAMTLFATHYHELNELERRLPRVKNFNVAVKEVEGKVLFLRKLEPGGSEHSFGIHVAEMAGMPGSLVKRARQLLKHFEKNRVQDQEQASQVRFSKKQTIQLNMFELKDADTLKIRQILQGVDVDRMTPIEALLKLQEIKQALLEEEQAAGPERDKG